MSRSALIKLFTFLGGIYFFLEFVLPESTGFGAYHQQISLGYQLIGVVAIGLGVINIFMIHGVRVAYLKAGWVNSAALIISGLVVAVLMVADWRADMAIEREIATIRHKADFYDKRPDLAGNEDPDTLRKEADRKREELVAAKKETTFSKLYELMFYGLFSALSLSMFSLLAFYIASAAFRAFRIRSIEATVMMGAALIVMLGQTPFGPMIWEGWPAMRGWLLEVPSAAAARAIAFGAEVAGFAMAIRVWLSIEGRRL